MTAADRSILQSTDEFLEVGVSVNALGQADSRVELSWRPTEKALAVLAEARAKDVHLLLVVEANGQEKQRQLFPLEWAKWSFDLTSSGKSTIHATIVWSDDPASPGASRALLESRRGFDWVTRPLVYERPSAIALRSRLRQVDRQLDEALDTSDTWENLKEEERLLKRQRENLDTSEKPQWMLSPDMFAEHYVDDAHQLGSVQVSVEVPKEMFSQPEDHWPLTVTLGNLLTDSPARDACHLRRRAMLTAIAFPWLVALMVAMALGLAVAAAANIVWGTRSINFRAVKPFALEEDGSLLEFAQPSRWWYRQTEDGEFVKRHPVFWVLNPPALLAAVLVWALLLGLGTSAVGATNIVLGIVLMAVVLALIGGWRRALDSQSAEDEAADYAKQVKQQYAVPAEQLGQISRVPVLQLRYRELKTQLCRPFER